jgi:DNA-binding PadR family transcriptional regulator
VLLDEEPRNGYQIIQDIAERSHGMWRPSPGSVYPALSQLEDEGLITAESEGSGRRYQLTPDGRTYVAEHRTELNAPWEAMAGERERQAEREPGLAQFTELMGQTGFAAIQVLRAGSPQQIEEARRLLDETRRGLYRILAESDPAEEDSYDDPDDPDGPDSDADSADLGEPGEQPTGDA